VGYDYRKESDSWDDALILADPYDKYDDYGDGYSYVNADRFYWIWFDALYFDDLTWRTMITATPKEPLWQKSNNTVAQYQQCLHKEKGDIRTFLPAI
jgi:hypothetical protein